jgi:hypothetical protein
MAKLAIIIFATLFVLAQVSFFFFVNSTTFNFNYVLFHQLVSADDIRPKRDITEGDGTTAKTIQTHLKEQLDATITEENLNKINEILSNAGDQAKELKEKLLVSIEKNCCCCWTIFLNSFFLSCKQELINSVLMKAQETDNAPAS